MRGSAMLDAVALASYAAHVASLEDGAFSREVADRVAAAHGAEEHGEAGQRVVALYRNAVDAGRMDAYQRGRAKAAEAARTDMGGLARAA